LRRLRRHPQVVGKVAERQRLAAPPIKVRRPGQAKVHQQAPVEGRVGRRAAIQQDAGAHLVVLVAQRAHGDAPRGGQRRGGRGGRGRAARRRLQDEREGGGGGGRREERGRVRRRRGCPASLGLLGRGDDRRRGRRQR